MSASRRNRGGGRLALAAFACFLGCALAFAAPAAAQDTGTAGFTQPPITIPKDLPDTPPGYSVDASAAIDAAIRDPVVAEARERYGEVTAIPEAKGGVWEIAYSADGDRVALIIVDRVRGEVVQAWTGAQVAWPMARGNEGQFGHILNAPYVWIPLSAIFFLGLFDLRRMRRIVHLDLLVLLSFGISHIYFNNAQIGVSTLLVYPPLLYLLARMLWIGFRGAGAGLRPWAPIGMLVFAAVFLICFRIAINIGDSGVIDVGYAGVIGADRITSGLPIYGENVFPPNNPTGDTYGPANYYAYVPFELAFGWSGLWDWLPAGRAAAIFFDLATIAGLFFLGRRLRKGRDGTGLGVLLAFAWAAYPYTTFALQSNSNDTLVAALLVWAMVLFASPVARAVTVALAATAKFVPLVVAPLFAVGERGLLDRFEVVRGGRPALIPVLYFAAIFIATTVLVLMHPAVDPGLVTFWDRTFGKQLGRESPFSIWGQVSGLGPLQVAVTLGAGALAIAVAFVPRRRSLVQIAALAAAVLIATELTLAHWFYLYIPWFFGLLIVALAARGESRSSTASTRSGGASATG